MHFQLYRLEMRVLSAFITSICGICGVIRISGLAVFLVVFLSAYIFLLSPRLLTSLSVLNQFSDRAHTDPRDFVSMVSIEWPPIL